MTTSRTFSALTSYPGLLRLSAPREVVNKALFRCPAKRYEQSPGISIVELLVAVVISSFAILVSSFIIASLGKNLSSTESIYDVQNTIDLNLSKIESAADLYTCSAANGALTCTVAANSAIPSKDGYVNVNDSTTWTLFKAKCDQTSTTGANDLITPLKDFINNDSSLNTPSNVFRQITVHGADSAQGLTHVRHMTIQYRTDSATGQILRDVTIMPTIVAYCP